MAWRPRDGTSAYPEMEGAYTGKESHKAVSKREAGESHRFRQIREEVNMTVESSNGAIQDHNSSVGSSSLSRVLDLEVTAGKPLSVFRA